MSYADLNSMEIVVVGDAADGRPPLAKMLRSAGYAQVTEVEDRAELEPRLRWHPAEMVLIDLSMDGGDGFAVLADLRPHLMEPELLPVCVITDDVSPALRRRAFQLGARDVLYEPVDEVELLMRVRGLLQSRWIQRHLEDELEAARLETLDRLSRVAERHDSPTYEHALRLGELAAQIAEGLGLPDAEVARIRRAAPLHDVGKIVVPERLLAAEEPRSYADTALIRSHTIAGSEILAGSESELVKTAAQIARSHHECWDGSGYPDGLPGEEIPLSARIVAVADTFDALVSDRPGKPAWTLQDALAEIRELSGKRFDPRVVDAFALALDPN